MKTIFAAIICILFTVSCFAQTAERKLYAESLSACVEKEAAEYSKINSKRNLANRFVEYDINLTSDLPKQFGFIKV